MANSAEPLLDQYSARVMAQIAERMVKRSDSRSARAAEIARSPERGQQDPLTEADFICSNDLAERLLSGDTETAPKPS